MVLRVRFYSGMVTDIAFGSEAAGMDYLSCRHGFWKTATWLVPVANDWFNQDILPSDFV